MAIILRKPSLPFGARSTLLLNQAHPDLRKWAIKLNGLWQCTILSGGRSLAQQKDYVNGTNFTGINPELRKLSKTLDSNHLIQPDGFAYALDIAPDPVNFERKSYNLDLIYFSGFAMRLAQEMFDNKEITHEIEYGGDWDGDHQISDESFKDTDHFQMKR